MRKNGCSPVAIVHENGFGEVTAMRISVLLDTNSQEAEKVKTCLATQGKLSMGDKVPNASSISTV